MRNNWGRISCRRASTRSATSRRPSSPRSARSTSRTWRRGTTGSTGRAHARPRRLPPRQSVPRASRPGFLDWACVAHAPGMRDVAYFLTNSLPVELRRQHERDLLERYRAGLAAAGASRCRRSTRPGATTAASRSTRGSPRPPPPPRAPHAADRDRMRAMERTNAAVRDLDSLALLREGLGIDSPRIRPPDGSEKAPAEDRAGDVRRWSARRLRGGDSRVPVWRAARIASVTRCTSTSSRVRAWVQCMPATWPRRRTTPTPSSG